MTVVIKIGGARAVASPSGIDGTGAQEAQQKVRSPGRHRGALLETAVVRSPGGNFSHYGSDAHQGRELLLREPIGGQAVRIPHIGGKLLRGSKPGYVTGQQIG